MTGGQARARQRERGKARRQAQGDARAQHGAAERRQRAVLGRVQVVGGVVLVGRCGSRACSLSSFTGTLRPAGVQPPQVSSSATLRACRRPAARRRLLGFVGLLLDGGLLRFAGLLGVLGLLTQVVRKRA